MCMIKKIFRLSCFLTMIVTRMGLFKKIDFLNSPIPVGFNILV